MKAANNELSSKYKSKSFQRQAGMDKAVDRLTKEEVELEQVEEDKYDRMLSRMIKNNPDLLKKHAKEVKRTKDIESGKELERHIKKNPDVLKARGVTKEEVELEQVDETVLHKDVEFEVNIAEKDYKTYFTAAMKGKDLGSMSPEEKKKHFNKVDAGYKAKNEDVFLEAMFDSHINDVIAAHKKAGNRISDEKSAMSDGKMKHSYVVTTPEGKRTRHIHHGSTKKLETMSPAARSKQSQEQDLDDK